MSALGFPDGGDGPRGLEASRAAATVRRLAGDPPSPYETAYGFSRAVCAGPFILIGGTTSVDPFGFVIGVTPYEQAAEVLRKLLRELERAGGEVGDVVALRVYVTDISRADEVGRAFGEVFAEVRPLLTMVEVSALIDPRMLVEIELTAYRPV
jgi:enamine deaminase RidA (YjgF/YER057c/UK114 family)